MDMIKQYIISIISAAVIGVIILSFCDKKNGIFGVIKIIYGIFLIITLLSPIIGTKKIFSGALWEMDVGADAYIQLGESYANQKKEHYIKEEITAYILDRAKAMDVSLEVEVDLKEDLSGPEVIYITGNIAPYKKEQLQNTIEMDLGVTKEQQIWQ